jgi:hypothetical protein
MQCFSSVLVLKLPKILSASYPQIPQAVFVIGTGQNRLVSRDRGKKLADMLGIYVYYLLTKSFSQSFIRNDYTNAFKQNK